MKSVRNSIVIASGNHLSSNPRVVKEAVALAAAGHEVEVLGSEISPEYRERDAKLTQAGTFPQLPTKSKYSH